MKIAKKLILSLSVFATMLVALICGIVNVVPQKSSLGGGCYQNSIDEVASDLNSDNDNNGIGTNVGVSNNSNNTNNNLNNTNSNNNSNTNKTPIKPQTFNFNEGEVVVQKGSGEIKYEYIPDNTQTATSVAYQYRFNNSMKVDMAVNLKSISTTSVTLSYVYSDTKLDTISSSSNIFEAQRISPNATKYIYIVVTPTSTSIPSTFQSSIVWYQGEAGEVEFVVNGEIISQAIVKGQIVEEPSITLPEGYTLEGWYTDSNYATQVTFPLRNQGTIIYAKLINPYILPSDWIAWDSSTSSYYVTKGTSTLPATLIIPETHNDGANGTANVTYIASASSEENGVFSNQTSLKSIELPSTITTIGDYAFYSCSGVSSVEFGADNKLTSMGNYAFSYCTSLTSIDLSTCGNLISIKTYAFNSCKKLTNIDLSKCSNLTSIETYAFFYCSALTTITLPSSLTNIGGGAFSSCSKLTNINLGECTNLVSMGNFTFAYCKLLTSITIPSNMIKIGQNVFTSCTSLTSITFADVTTWYRGTETQQTNMSGGTETDVSDASANATYFTSTYEHSLWYKL